MEKSYGATSFQIGRHLMGHLAKVVFEDGSVLVGGVKWAYSDYIILVVNQVEGEMAEKDEIKVYIPAGKIKYIVQINKNASHEIQDREK